MTPSRTLLKQMRSTGSTRAFSVPRQSVMRPASIDADGRYHITTVILVSKLLHVEQFVILNHELLYMVTKKF